MEHQISAAATRSERVNINLMATCGLISGTATLSLLIYLFWMAYGSRRLSAGPNPFHVFLRTDAGKYLVSLLTADLFHSIAYTTGFHWVRIELVQPGPTCTLQAIFLQLGDLANPIWIFTISCHTFVFLFLSRRPPNWVSPIILGVGWLTTILLPILGPAVLQGDKPFYDAGSRLWCWVSDDYSAAQLLYFFVWAMCALGGSILCYTLIFLRTAGWISGSQLAPAYEPQADTKSRPSWMCMGGRYRNSAGSTEGSSPGSPAPFTHRKRSEPTIGRSLHTVGRKLILYPVAYAFLVLPLTISSLLNMTGIGSPEWFLVLSTCIYALGGTVDTILFVFTRRSFIQNASSGSRLQVRRGMGRAGNVPGQRENGGITVTQHEVTVVELHELASTRFGTMIKDQDLETLDAGFIGVRTGKHDGPFG